MAVDGAADVVDGGAANQEPSAVRGFDGSSVGAGAGAAQLKLKVVRTSGNVRVDGAAVVEAREIQNVARPLDELAGSRKWRH